jgi:allantoin racemase
VRHFVAVPLVEQTIAAVKMAEAIVALAPIKATRGSFRRPPATPSIGLPQNLADRIAHTGS